MTGPLTQGRFATARLGHVAEVTLGKMVQTKPSDGASLAPYIKARNVRPVKVELASLEQMYATPSEQEVLNVREGDIFVIEGGATAGRAAVVLDPPPVDCVFQNAVHRIRAKPSADQRFLYYVLAAYPSTGWYEAVCSAATFKHLTGEKMSVLPVPLPPLDTQRRIADMLDAETARIDTLIEKNERVIDLAWLRYRVLRLRSLGGGYELGSARASEWAEARGWPVAPLWLISVNHDSRRIPLNAEERGLRQGPYPYWGANSIQDHIDSWLFDGPHVLIGEDGAPFFVEERDVAWVAEGRYWVNNHAHVLEAVGVDTWWLAECLNVVDYSLFVTGSTRDKLTQDGLNRIPVPTPSPTERAAVLRELKRARELAAELANHCRRQQELLSLRRQALITAAVTGEIEI